MAGSIMTLHTMKKIMSGPVTTIVSADAAEVVRAYGNEVRFRLTGSQTGGQFTMFTDTTPPGGGPPPHFHVLEDEWWFIVEGRAEFFMEGQWQPVAAGGAVFAARHSFHTFKNTGDTSLKTVVHLLPSGFETFFRKSQAEFQKGGAPDMKRIREIGAEHGIYLPTINPADAAKRGKPALLPAIVQPGEGRVCRMFGEEVTILLDAKQTGGKFTAFIEVTQPGGGPPPHTLANEDEWLFVLEGQMQFFAEGKWVDAPPGTTFLAPRGSVHTFKNVGSTPSRMLVHTSPSGLEKFFDAAHAEFGKPGGPDMNRAMAIAAEHGIQFV